MKKREGKYLVGTLTEKFTKTDALYEQVWLRHCGRENKGVMGVL